VAPPPPAKPKTGIGLKLLIGIPLAVLCTVGGTVAGLRVSSAIRDHFDTETTAPSTVPATTPATEALAPVVPVTEAPATTAAAGADERRLSRRRSGRDDARGS
jgi:hypothetical protein